MLGIQQITSLATRGKLSRREFVQLALALGITVTAAESLFVSIVRAAEPKRGGFCRLGFANGSTTDSLDPGYYLDNYTMSTFWGALSNSLTEVDATGEIQGDLAESMEQKDKAKTWVFKLRNGLTFHNGKDVTADDVVASLHYHMGPDSKSAGKAMLTSVVDLAVEGRDTIIVKLKEGNVDFPYLLSYPSLVIMPSRDGMADWSSGIRTGAFVLEKFEAGISTKLKRNPNYHKEGKPYFDEVETIPLIDPVARTTALTTGEIQWMNRCDLQTLDELQKDNNIAITEVTGFGHYTLPMLCDVAPFTDVNVRLAIKHAVDREDIARRVFVGHAAPANDDPIPPPPSIKYAIDPNPRFSYDPDRAKFYLKKAGLTSLQVDLSVADAAFQGAVDVAVLCREHAAKCGIDINVIREPNDGYWDNVWQKKSWCASYWSGRSTCDWMFSDAYLSISTQNESHWKNPHFDELLFAARSEVDEAKRATMYAEMQQLIHDDGGALVLVFRNYVDAHSKRIAHDKIANNWECDGLRIAERWWFA